jgi:hypothetical protein
MNENKNLKSGTYFLYGGMAYQFVRDAKRQQQTPNRNQWGRAEGGTHTSDVLVVRINMRHKGIWTKYVAFPANAVGSVTTKDRFLNPPSKY